MNELTGLPNPFRDNVVTDAWQSPADVADIHREVFDACLEGIQAASRGEPDSLLVFGPAGSGKTHLLTRVQRHLAETARQAPDQVLRCVFVYVRLQTAPQLLWQHVRRRLANDLMRREEGLTQLQRLVAHQWSQHEGIRPRGAVLRMRVLGAEDHSALSNHMIAISSKLGLPRDLGVVLEHLVLNRWTRDASAWLAGDSLPERALEDLGLGTDLSADREGAAREAVLGLCKLAAETLPIVFCFDQVEALLRSRKDDDAFFRFGRLAGDLHDADPNVFLLTCVQSGQVESLKRAVLQPDFDRLAKRNVTLSPLNEGQIESLLLARLEAAEALQPIRKAHATDPYHPFGAAFVQELSKDTPCVPRRVLASCAIRFEQLQRGLQPRRVATADFLSGELDRRVERAAQRLAAGETRSVVIGGAEVLAGLERAAPLPLPEGSPEEIDLILEDRRTRERSAVSVRDEADGRSLRPRLAALLHHLPNLDGARLVIVRDPRVPLSPKATKAREHLVELRAKGAAIVEPTVEALAALATLSSILADAKSGDLANEGEPIGESMVLSWLAALAEKDPARVAPIEELARGLFPSTEEIAKAGGKPSDQAGAEESLRLALADLLSRYRIIPADEASRAIGVDAERLLELSRRSPERCLVLEGPPALLLDMAGVVTDAEGGR